MPSNASQPTARCPHVLWLWEVKEQGQVQGTVPVISWKWCVAQPRPREHGTVCLQGWATAVREMAFFPHHPVRGHSVLGWNVPLGPGTLHGFYETALLQAESTSASLLNSTGKLVANPNIS